MQHKIGVISPSLPLKSEQEVETAVKRLADYAVNVEFFTSKSKLEDFMRAQASEADVIMTSRGGFNSVELLPKLDFSKITKPLCGYSDITVLLNALLAQTGKVQYLGPNLKALNGDVDDYGIKNFISVALEQKGANYHPAKAYMDTHISKTQTFANPGLTIINEGKAKGRLVGGNLCSQIMLAGTKYYPVFDDMIIIAEEDDLCGTETFNMFMRNLWALFNYDFAKNIRGLIIGRFMQNSFVDVAAVKQKLQVFEALHHIPVIAGFDTGHTLPQMTLPLGKEAILDTASDSVLSF